jgi:hypothetical protein
MKSIHDIEEVKVNDIVDFRIPTKKPTSPVKDVDLLRRMLKINYFEDPVMAIDRVNEWVSFDDLFIVKQADIDKH